MTNHTIDATGKKLGRVASEVAKLLMGKNTAEFERNIAPKVSVAVNNVSKIVLDPKNLKTKMYKNFSGFAGGLREESREHLIERLGMKEVFRLTVYGMLPTNKLRAKMINNLKISE